MLSLSAFSQLNLHYGLDVYGSPNRESFETNEIRTAPSMGINYTFNINDRHGISIGVLLSTRTAETYIPDMTIPGAPIDVYAKVAERYHTIPVMWVWREAADDQQKTVFTTGVGVFVSACSDQRTLFDKSRPAPINPDMEFVVTKGFSHGKIGPCLQVGVTHQIAKNTEVFANLSGMMEFDKGTIWGKKMQNFSYYTTSVQFGVNQHVGKSKKVENVD